MTDESASTEPVNILLVDDQPGKLMTYEAILDGLDANLIKATTAEEALTTLLKTDIAVILMDVCMPDLDGFELAAMIRDHPRHEKTAVIFISAVRLEIDDLLKGYRTGCEPRDIRIRPEGTDPAMVGQYLRGSSQQPAGTSNLRVVCSDRA
jgi:CheY-like chemotaxis protein